MILRLRVVLSGAVQGVGFRPFVYRLATELSLGGRVANDSGGVVLEVEGPRADLERFLARLVDERPPSAVVTNTVVEWIEPVCYSGFSIDPSESEGVPTVQVLPDIATCPRCAEEILDPADRRFGYPFTNCTNCGPRLTIIRALPYDRPNTTMSPFIMCEACREEYDDPLDRRFHAQPNACHRCGPRLALWSREGRPLLVEAAALREAVSALGRGRIVAVKGLGGFHLVVDARDGEALARLRAGKPRREKPFALMAGDMEQTRRLCRIDETAAAALDSPEAPILILPRLSGAPVHGLVAPGNPYLGVMLPPTPLHRLLLNSFRRPVVATSGNLGDEPVCTDEKEAVERLGSIADLFLVHDRPIARHADDSVAWMFGGRSRLMRRARGHAPRPVLLDAPVPVLLAVGAHLKNTVALSVGRQVVVSQHIGDMENPRSIAAFEAAIDDFLRLYETRPVGVVHDLHPDYASTRWARAAVDTDDGSCKLTRARGRLEGLPMIPVQHHHAHMVACLAENSTKGPALGVTFDGAGLGSDGTIWGGEFLLGSASSFVRVAHLRGFRLPGGDAVVREPRRAALALLWEIEGDSAFARDDLDPLRSFTVSERRMLAAMLERGVRTPSTTSAGRLFDAIAALIGLQQRSSFEAQAAMALEFVADPAVGDEYPIDVRGRGSVAESGPLVLDWEPLLRAILEDQRRGVPAATIAARFHNALAGAIVRVAQEVGEPRVALTGGCFQNRLLLERTVAGLRRAGFEVLLHRHVPPNDGGISLGQIAVAAARLAAG